MNCINFVVPMNPCRCGFYPDRKKCSCTSFQIKGYLNRISQPMLDRMDICAETVPLTYQDFQGQGNRDGNEPSSVIRGRVAKAQKIQDRRYKKEAIFHNAQLTPSLLGKYCVLEKEAQEYLEEAFYKLEFSARAYHKILKVSRTIADLAGKDKIGQRHIAEAVCYRMLDKKYWGSEGE